jgi:hypothetical protein
MQPKLSEEAMTQFMQNPKDNLAKLLLIEASRLG